MFLIKICFLILIKSIFIESELFTSTTHLTQLLNTEIALAKELERYFEQGYERLDDIEKFVNVIKDEIRHAQENEEYYFWNPINSYLFIKHLTVDWHNIKEMLPADFSKNLDNNLLFPSLEDYNGCAIGLMRLQDIYKLNPSHLANGEISSKFKSKRLNGLECYELGRVAYAHEDFYHTLMWMQEALDRLDTSINKIDILDHLAQATSKQGNIEHALAITEQILTIDPNHVRANSNKISYKTIIKNRTLTINKDKTYEIKNERPDDVDEDLEEREIYETLCRQNKTELHPIRQSTFFCRYRHNNHPYLILQPIKEEQIFDYPIIYLYYDVLTNSDIEQIKSLALPKMKRSTVQADDTLAHESVSYRVSKSAWLSNKDSPVIARLSRLIEAVTNLSMETAEDFQIANYGIGGHYEPHVDFFETPNHYNGNRIATWLTYMSDVEQGGATVFPETGGYVKPKKGSAAFWYNLFQSGDQDYDTLHAGCPVLIGNKWIANKWIHEYGQEFRRPCSLDPME